MGNIPGKHVNIRIPDIVNEEFYVNSLYRL